MPRRRRGGRGVRGRPVCWVRIGWRARRRGTLPFPARVPCPPVARMESAAGGPDRSGRRGPCGAAPRAATASCWRRDSAGTPCGAGAPASPWARVTPALLRVTRRSGFLPVWYIAVAVAIGEGRKACTWSARNPLRLSQRASSSMSSSVVPGCAAMKYGIRYCSLPAGFRILIEQLLEAVVGADAWLHHHGQRALAHVLGGDLEIAADVVLGEFAHVLGRFDGEVVAHPRGDQHLLYARQLARAPIQADQRAVVGVEIRADARKHAGRPAAGALDLADSCRRCDTCWPSGRPDPRSRR